MKKAAALILLTFIVMNTFAQEADSSDILLPGQSMPQFTVTTMDGKVMSSDQLKGKIVLINFFATWCGPCRTELPFVQSDIYDRYKDRKDFVLMVISREEKPEKVIPFVEEKQFPMTFYSDVDRSCYSQFAHQFIPRNYLFDHTGKLVYKSKGFVRDEFDQLLKQLEQMLK